MSRRPNIVALVGGATRFALTTVLVLATVALVFAFAASSQASAQGTQERLHDPHRRDSHTCSASKGHKGHVKGRSKTGTRRAEHHAANKGAGREAQVGRRRRALRSDLLGDAYERRRRRRRTFTCANGSEPGCAEGFTPVVSADGAALLCEPEAINGSEAGDGEEEG